MLWILQDMKYADRVYHPSTSVARLQLQHAMQSSANAPTELVARPPAAPSRGLRSLLHPARAASHLLLRLTSPSAAATLRFLGPEAFALSTLQYGAGVKQHTSAQAAPAMYAQGAL